VDSEARCLVGDRTARGSEVRGRLNREGYLIRCGVLDLDLIAEAGDHVSWLQERYPDRRGEDLTHELVALDPFWVRLVSDDRLLDIAEMIVGPNIAPFASHYISKPLFVGKQVLWHQDSSYWPLEPMEAITLWLAIDPSTSENGCVRVIPGSHKGEVHPLRRRDDVENVLGSESAAEIDESLAVDLELAPGDVEVHHPSIVHGSNANTSPYRRCGLTIRYIPTSTRVTSAEHPFASALLHRGEPSVNLYQPWPEYRPGEHFGFSEAETWNAQHGHGST